MNILESHDIIIGLIDLGDNFDTIHIFGNSISDDEAEKAIENHINATNRYNGKTYEIIEIIR